jgi:hypothetical protein
LLESFEESVHKSISMAEKFKLSKRFYFSQVPKLCFHAEEGASFWPLLNPLAHHLSLPPKNGTARS